MLSNEFLTPEQTKAAAIRNVDNCENICQNYFEKNQNWDYVKNGKFQNLRTTVKENEGTQTAPEHFKQYPLNWFKGNSLIFEVQADYYQYETEEGDKLHGYCRTLIFYTTSKADALKITNGEHPVNLGYKLLPIPF